MKKLIYTIVIWAIAMLVLAENGSLDNGGIEVGQKAPSFIAIDTDGNKISLSEELNKGPVVLIFYRGEWCPVCNKHLKTLQDSLEFLQGAGARVLAVSPQKIEYQSKLADRTKAEFPLLYDENYKIMNAYGVTFSPDKATATMYNLLLGADLKSSQSDDSQRLPVPATYVINTQGIIAWKHFNADYKQRASVKSISEALKTSL